MKEANKNGIDVVESLIDPTFKKDEEHARYVLYSTIGEDDSKNSNVMVVKDDQMTFVKNNSTGNGLLALFD